jgi:hypothetical protein
MLLFAANVASAQSKYIITVPSPPASAAGPNATAAGPNDLARAMEEAQKLDALGPASLAPIAALLSPYVEQYAQAGHDLKRNALRKERALALCEKLAQLSGDTRETYAFRGWRGRLQGITEVPLFSGYAVTVELQPPLSLWARFDAKSPMLSPLTNIPVRSFVAVDGTLTPSKDDCVQDASLTTAGMMRAPEFRVTPERIGPMR